MERANREFDMKSFMENDQKGRESVIQFFKTKGISATDNPNIMGVDLILNGLSPASGRVFRNYGCEVSRSPTWNSDNEWPFDTHHIPARKEKFFNSECLYAVVNKNGSRIMFIVSYEILKHPIKEIPTKHRPEGELFYIIPLQKFTTYEINWN